MSRSNFLYFALVLCFVASCATNGAQSDYPKSADEEDVLGFYEGAVTTESYPLVIEGDVHNVILCIGDGMGLSQVTLGRLHVGGLDGKLHIERMPVMGFIRTHSADEMVTDSAAAGTALSTGFKTDNGVVAMTPAGKVVRTILEAAQSKGLATGLVATSSITHATPACFGSHVRERDMETDIAEDLLENRVDVLLGGGRKYFLPEDEAKSAREDKRDLVAEAKTSGYAYVTTAKDLEQAQGDRLLGLFHMGDLKNKRPEPTLAEMTGKAIEILSRDEDGFFMMVEGSQIDWACHEGNKDYALREMLHFDMAVKEAIDFALKDKHTLVIVTADHETGGLIIKGGRRDGQKLELGWSSSDHTATPVPVFAMGPQALCFTGMYDNTELPKRLDAILELPGFPMVVE